MRRLFCCVKKSHSHTFWSLQDGMMIRQSHPFHEQVKGQRARVEVEILDVLGGSVYRFRGGKPLKPQLKQGLEIMIKNFLKMAI